MKTAAIVVAAGRGLRAGGDQPKQYCALAGRTVLSRALAPFLAHPGIGAVAVVINPDDIDLYRASIAAAGPRLLEPVTGGATRQLSVLTGMERLAPLQPEAILVHDAARPFVTPAIIDRVLAGLEAHPGAIAAEPVVDTLKRAGPGGTIAGTVDRAGLWRAQTPQGFRFDAILAAHRKAQAQGRTDFTDDAALAEWAGIPVALVAGDAGNVKITTAGDLAAAALRLAAAEPMETRTGNGFDVHRFGPGDHVWLCGISIPHDARLEGHSDADVGLHALTDAILGALGDGDIGQHFPPSDPKWKDAASRQFLADAARRVSLRQGTISNVDVTLMCEAPKIGPHREAMRATVAAILGIDIARVGVKATTTEGLGFTGRREGIAAMATATLLLPAASA